MMIFEHAQTVDTGLSFSLERKRALGGARLPLLADLEFDGIGRRNRYISRSVESLAFDSTVYNYMLSLCTDTAYSLLYQM